MTIARASRRWVGALMGIFGAVAASTSNAGSLASPSEKPILTISGKIESTNKGDTAQFDRAMLESLGTESIDTKTPWHEGKVKFEGVSLDKLMKHVGANGTRVVVTALNDYVTEIPIDDFEKYGPILALKQNGEYMPVSDKGPLFIVYPYDQSSELQSQLYYGRSAWQVNKMEIR